MIFTQTAAKEKIAALEARITELEFDANAHQSQVETLQGEITAKDQTIAEHVASIAAKDETIADITGKLSISETALATATEELAAKDLEIEAAKNSAGQIATETLASIGQPEPLPIESGESAPTDHFKHLATLKGAERTAYYAEHEAEIKAALAK